MVVNVVGLVVVGCFYIAILVVGILAARRKGHPSTPSLQTSIVADRDLPLVVGIFTMTGRHCLP